MSAPRVLFYVQHLLGIGHLKRALTLGRALVHAGMDVTVVSGGDDVPVLDTTGLTFLQLPPVKAADRQFSAILGPDGEELDEALKSTRRDRLLEIFAEIDPTALIIELFPFGRRAMRFELLPLIDAARARQPRPLIISSVRDVLVEKNRPERDAEMVATADDLFDHVLVHGDPEFIAFDATFPLASKLINKLKYTGYIVENKQLNEIISRDGEGEVIVSSGGGRIGEGVLRAALETRPLTSLKHHTWRLLAGQNLPQDVFDSLRDAAPDGVIVERARADFVTLLKNCHLSVSQGGYNTIMEILLTRARAVAVPYAGGNESEQTLRTQLLAERGLLQVVREDELTPQRLAAAIERAISGPPPPAAALDMDGAAKSAGLVRKWIDIRG